MVASNAFSQNLPYAARPGTPQEIVETERFTRELGFAAYNGFIAEHCGRRQPEWRQSLMEALRSELRQFATRHGNSLVSSEAIGFLGVGKISFAVEVAAEHTFSKPPGDCSGITDQASLDRADAMVARVGQQAPRR